MITMESKQQTCLDANAQTSYTVDSTINYCSDVKLNIDHNSIINYDTLVNDVSESRNKFNGENLTDVEEQDSCKQALASLPQATNSDKLPLASRLTETSLTCDFSPIFTECVTRHENSYTTNAPNNSSSDATLTVTNLSQKLPLGVSNSVQIDTPTASASSLEHSQSCSVTSSYLDNSQQVQSDREIALIINGTDATSAGILVSTRSRRRCVRQKSRSLSLVCPVCRIILHTEEEVNNHVDTELQRLSKPIRCRNPEHHRIGGVPRKELYQTFLRIKHNRQIRLGARQRSDASSPTGAASNCNRRRANSSSGRQLEQRLLEGSVCPICLLTIAGTEQQISQHVDRCLRMAGGDGDDVDVVDEESSEDNDDEEYEEYQWAGQTRIRASSIRPSHSAGSCIVSIRSNDPVNDAVDLNIEDDDTICYGPAQFSEVDLIRCQDDESDDQALREVLTGGKTSMQGESASDSKWDLASSSSASTENCSASRSIQKQSQSNGATPTCLICMEPYTEPLTSIQCWHVHCQECWLRTLGVKKLCPQCNTITSPQDLRKIFI